MQSSHLGPDMTTFDIDRTAPAQGRATLRIQAPVGQVWALLSNLDDWPRWNPDIGRIYVMGPPAVGTPFEWKAGGLAIYSVIRVFDPPHAIGWTGQAPLISAHHVYRLKDLGDGTTGVETEESFSGVFARLAPWLARRMIQGALAKGLQALKAAAETPPPRITPKRAA